MSAPQKLTFPTVQKIQLHSFSLYRVTPNLSITLPRGVFCLAGANGLGKTTFLATLNYGLTGIVPNLDSNFLASIDYYQDNYRDRSFTRNFFNGRIAEKDRDDAGISLELHVGSLQFKLKRYLFNYEGLPYLQITNLNTGEIEYEGNEDETEQNETEYQHRLCEAMGITAFEQYVFLQHFVLTFDESRRLLLWDSHALNEALYLCIGADYGRARQASELTRAMEKAGSRARNTQFQATNVRTRIETILKEFSKTANTVVADNEVTPEELEATHRALFAEAEKMRKRTIEKQLALKDCDLRWIERSSNFSSLHAEFEREFTRRIESRTQIHFHPTISASLSEDRCAICHSPSISTSLQSVIDHNKCPLCDSQLPQQEPDDAARDHIRKLDESVAQAREALKEVLQTKERLTNELRASEDSEQAASAQLRAFETANSRTLRRGIGRSDEMNSTIQRLETELIELQKQKEAHYADRDEKRRRLLILQKDLKRAYATAEEEFVPLLQNLATAFLGLDLEVAMEAKSGISDFGLSLVLSLRGSARREDTQLSESQRFFLDIALRMALAQYISNPDGLAELLIDTPEGSLDIAYEARAGSMFAKFVKSGHNLFMTANINSSQLLLELAKECGQSLMSMARMTSWTELSDVQTQAKGLFNKAYAAIEAEQLT